MIYDTDKSLSRFRQLLQFETVAGNDDEFVRFKKALCELYPRINDACDIEQIGESGLMYRLKGVNSDKSLVLAAHYDVVPASPEQWKKPPFSGEITKDDTGNDVIWGRGTIDTKCTLCSIMESVEALIELKYIPEYDIYMCFGGNEETTGNDAVAIAAVLQERGIQPFLIIDEGGAIIDLPDFLPSKRAALVGIAEKGYIDIEFVVRCGGGHTSLRVKNNPIVVMAEVIRRLDKPFKFTLSKPVQIMSDAISARAGFKLRTALNSPILHKLFMPRLIKAIPELDALTKTIGSFTMINGGSAVNVVPEEVRAVGNFRIISGSSVDETIGIIKKALRGLDVDIIVKESIEPSSISKVNGEGWDLLNHAIKAVWGGESGDETSVVPFLMLARSDSRFYGNICDSIYRFTPMIMNISERKSLHGVNEKIKAESFKKMIEFYMYVLGERTLTKK
ncbi:MAG: M20/M25/M40 family metallo-hydrolase [Oscillospiraceae bacterium]|nr:M20/M25/M40 family metallo-hydrolase [Oscillospiraceae bacterium]